MAASVRYSFCAIHLNSWPATRGFVETLWPQLWVDAEIVVVDGGSTDASRAYLEAFAREHPDRFKLVVDPGGNRGRGRDLAWRAARGDTIVHIDADRVWKPTALADLRAIAEARRGRHVIVRSVVDGTPIGGANLIPRALLERLGGYDASLTYFEDVDLNNRSERVAPIEWVEADLCEKDWKAKMKRPGYLVNYYYGMCRDGARMRGSLRRQLRYAIRRPTSWPFVVVGTFGYLVGRLSPPAKSVAEASAARGPSK